MLMGDDQCWFRIINDKFKVSSENIKKYGINTDICVQCKFSITSMSYQQNQCGSRYCQDCFQKLKPKYYCLTCKEEDSNNFVHQIDNVFEDKALKKDLEKMSIRCPDCSSEMKLIDLEKHVLEDCVHGWTECRKCQSMIRKHSHRHICQSAANELVSEHKMCTSYGKDLEKGDDHQFKMDWTKECPFGCSEKGAKMESHRSESSLYHLDKCWAILKEFQMTECKRHEDSSQHTEWLDSTIDKLKVALKYDPEEVQRLKEEVSALTKEMEEEREILESIKTSLINNTTELQSTCFDGTIMWRLDHFSKLRDDAQKGLQQSIFSPPFYTSRFGYKMCLRFYPNGDSTAKGTAMSLFLVILKGKYDAILRWPFKQKVTFMLINYDLKNHWKDEFMPSDSMASFLRPTEDMNIPAGNSYFIKFDHLNKNLHKFAKENIVFIRCVVDCSDLHE